MSDPTSDPNSSNSSGLGASIKTVVEDATLGVTGAVDLVDEDLGHPTTFAASDYGLFEGDTAGAAATVAEEGGAVDAAVAQTWSSIKGIFTGPGKAVAVIGVLGIFGLGWYLGRKR